MPAPHQAIYLTVNLIYLSILRSPPPKPYPRHAKYCPSQPYHAR